MAQWELAGEWSYSGNPTSSNRDAIRFLVGDTDKTDKLVSDQEIDFARTESGANTLAAAVIAEHLAARFSREVDKTTSTPGALSLTTSLSQRAAAYRALATRLRAQVALSVSPYCGGISRADKDTIKDDDDRVEPLFERGQFDFDADNNDGVIR